MKSIYSDENIDALFRYYLKTTVICSDLRVVCAPMDNKIQNNCGTTDDESKWNLSGWLSNRFD